MICVVKFQEIFSEICYFQCVKNKQKKSTQTCLSRPSTTNMVILFLLATFNLFTSCCLLTLIVVVVITSDHNIIDLSSIFGKNYQQKRQRDWRGTNLFSQPLRIFSIPFVLSLTYSFICLIYCRRKRNMHKKTNNKYRWARARIFYFFIRLYY